jgi:hypothetical protein
MQFFFHAVTAVPILLAVSTKLLCSQTVYLHSVVYCVLEFLRFHFSVRLISKYLAFCHCFQTFSMHNLSVYVHMYALCESVLFLTVDYMWEMLLYIYVIISYK